MSECIHCEGHGWNMERGPDGVTPDRYKCEHCNGAGENKMSEPINDGGPAFPHDERDSNGQFRQHFGMTLRDYFAGQALTGWLTSFTKECYTPNPEWIAKFSYQIADAMIAARGGAK